MNLPSLIQEAYKALGALVVWVSQNRQRVLGIVTVVTALVVAWQSWFSYGEMQLALFVGPPGSTTAYIGPDLVNTIAKSRNANGVNYRIELEPTPESVSIRERMVSESRRIPLGVIEDGAAADVGEGKDLRALLPMEWDYLFVICNRRILTEDNADARDLAEVIHDVLEDDRKGRLYLGPEKTSTHAMARVALKKFSNDYEASLAKGISDWRQMKTAFKNNELDLAFYSGPLGAELIDEIARDGKAVLLSLGDITDAIQHEEGFQYYSAKLPKNLFVAKEHVSTKPSSDSDAPVAFCREDLRTIASRRVLACPRSLSTADAYILASVARTALQDGGYHINLMANDPPVNAQKDVPSNLRMLPHPGLEVLRAGGTPFVWLDWTTWPGWLQTAASIFLGLLALDAIRLLTSRNAVNDYRRLDKLLLTDEVRIDEKTYREIANELGEWDESLRKLRTDIRSSRNLTESQRKALWRRYRRLAYLIESSPNWVAGSGSKRSKDELAE